MTAFEIKKLKLKIDPMMVLSVTMPKALMLHLCCSEK
jgi:hypothetical protein